MKIANSSAQISGFIFIFVFDLLPWADIQIVGWSISSTKTIDQSNLNTNLEKEPLLTLFRLLIVPLNNHGTEVYRLMVGGIRVWWVWRVQECGAWIYPARESELTVFWEDEEFWGVLW